MKIYEKFDELVNTGSKNSLALGISTNELSFLNRGTIQNHPEPSRTKEREREREKKTGRMIT